jgi:ribonuclease BN (tRNA processing enzyme)
MFKRNHSSLFIEDAKILVDCPEDIGDSLYRSGVKEVEHLFITHWHPDHTFWLRILLESTFDFYKRETVGSLILHLPKSVHEDLKKHYPTISYLIDTKKNGDNWIYWTRRVCKYSKYNNSCCLI